MGSEGSDPLLLVSLLVSRDSGFVFEDVSNFVEAFEDAGLGKRIDGKRYCRAAFNRHCLGREVDRHEYTRLQKRVSGRFDGNREQSILQAILAEDVGETCRDDRFETEVLECPYRVFSRATAAKVISGDENLGSFLYLKFRTVLEQMLTDADLVCDLQKASRNDLIRIDILLGYNNDA